MDHPLSPFQKSDGGNRQYHLPNIHFLVSVQIKNYYVKDCIEYKVLAKRPRVFYAILI